MLYGISTYHTVAYKVSLIVRQWEQQSGVRFTNPTLVLYTINHSKMYI